jgi:cephalosporin hydroxylase
MSQSDHEQFKAEGDREITSMAADETLQTLTTRWFNQSCRHKYSYHFTWMGLPIIQYPQDIVALQEIIWQVQPEVIIETGIARGGSLVFYAAMLELLGGAGQVVGIDRDIRSHNRVAIENHPMFKRITLLEGSSVTDHIVQQVHTIVQHKAAVLVVLDSLHTHEHVLREMNLYAPFVTPGSYLVVLDTVIEDMPPELLSERPWEPGNSPKTAVHAFLQNNPRFAIDHSIQQKLLITVAPDGYLKRIA